MTIRTSKSSPKLGNKLSLAAVAAGVCIAWPALAQSGGEASLQRVEVTGSIIKRVAAEGASPVQTFTAAEIAQTGATSVTEFIQQLPAMQGYTSTSDSVGGGGGGLTTASLHDIGESYTLVLVNGRRIAPATSGSTIDINGIPLSAIERIEVLTDGASALYGSDAIAGVVNFILKKGESPFAIEYRLSRPQAAGAGGNSLNLSKGFGNLDKDGYSLFLSTSIQKEESLMAAQRKFASTGIINFPDPANGQNLQLFNGSSRSIPPNVAVEYQNGVDATTGLPKYKTRNVNPYALNNGACAPMHVDLGDGNCYFDYASTVQIQPEVSRNNFYVSGEAKLGESGFTAFANYSFSETHTKATIAPYPAEFSLAQTSPLFEKYVKPFLTAAQLANFTSATVKYRLLDMGGRGYDYQSNASNTVAGIDGTAMGWDVNAAVTISKNNSPQNYFSGFPLDGKFAAAMDSGAIDPFAYAAGQMPPAMIAALKATGYVGNYNTTDITMDGYDVRVSRPVFKMPGGDVQLGLGTDYRRTSYSQLPNAAVAHAEILFDDDQPSFNLNRKNIGGFAELSMPITKQIEVNAAVRYDAFTGVTDTLNQKTTGDEQSAGTYKLSARFQPSNSMMFRAAMGTGFKAPSMLAIAQPLTDFGVTAGTYNCPLPSSNPLSTSCTGSKSQLEAFTGGNPLLKPETSVQKSLGTVLDVSDNFSMKFDLWSVDIKDAITSPTEQMITSDPSRYASLYTTKYKKSSNRNDLAIIFSSVNIGKAEYSGLDYDFAYKANNVAGGTVTSRLSGTHLFVSRYTTPGKDDTWETSLGAWGTNNAVSFPDILRISAAYARDGWTNGMTVNYRSGYKDVNRTADECAVSIGDANGDCIDVQLSVPAYVTVDWQTKAVFGKMEVTGGIINLFDRNPPLTLRTTGSHQLGYDPRYATANGRTFYLTGAYKF